MTKKSILLLSSILASAALVGVTFAAYAITDNANPLGVDVTPGALEDDTETKYVTLKWGESTSLSTIENATAGTVYKLGIINLEATRDYSGVFTVTLTDETSARPEGQKRFIDYLKLYLYDGAHNEVEEGALPTGDPLATTAKGGTLLKYMNALGTASGKEYSLYIEVDESAISYIGTMQNDVVDISIDWSAQEEDIHDEDKTVYFSTNWNKCYLYTWNTKGQNAGYPGIELSKVGLNQYGQNVFSGVLLDGYTKMIFSNGGTEFENKTNDLTIADYNTLFSQSDLLFWREDDGSAGVKVFEDSDVANYASNMADNPGPILQAWGWTTSYITSHLDDIKNANYKAIQVSPLQPLNDGGSNQRWSMIYQPVGFSVATGSTNPLGNKDSLKTLTAAAKEKGIDIIMDVVANHLAAGSDYQLHSAVQAYEPEIYNNNLIHHVGEIGNDDGNTEKLVRGNLGKLPDLMTEDTRIQNRVISMLKEYIDCGVSGFRFDAAKHIETPDDGDYASNFWPNVISEVNKYGLQKLGKFPYSYGEVLGVGTYRSWNGYTRYLDVTDYGVVWQTRDNYNKNDEGGVINNSGYTIKQPSEYALLFSESHDNFVHKETNLNADVWEDNQYGWHTARSGASSLYFPRPDYGGSAPSDPDTTNIVVTPTDNYKSPVVSAANKLHNDFEGGSEYLSAWDGCVINARQKGDNIGIYIANVHGSDSATVKVAINGGYIPNGTYKNLVNNTNYTASDGSITVPLTNGVAVLIKL